MRKFLTRTIVALFSLLLMPDFFAAREPEPQGVAVRYQEGIVHGFLVLRTLEGDFLADGELIQCVSGNKVTSRIIFRFKDGSLHDESTVFSQRGKFHLLADHLVQKGPAFGHPVDVSINGTTGQVSVHYLNDEDKKNDTTQTVKIPPDLANGMIFTLIKNMAPGEGKAMFSFLALSPKPRLVRLEVTTQDKDLFSVGEAGLKATRYLMKAQIGGVSGLVAPLVGKQPPESQVWILEGEAPILIKAESSLCGDCPVWRIELVSPVGPKAKPATDSK